MKTLSYKERIKIKRKQNRMLIEIELLEKENRKLKDYYRRLRSNNSYG